ncbi:hypothetical protein [Acrocarpospora corrugata]|uniref:hypothetical protein n=1 Tax=Acrocarpospora corrugata TaxID=35763 RepID=UPI0012D33112|nr:hypothetical protein [Acrocarpospora corrugata]
MWTGRTPGSAAFTAAVGFLLLALAMFASTPAWAADTARQSSECSADVITPGTQVSSGLALPPTAARTPGLVSRLLPAPNWAQPASAFRQVWPDAGSADIRDPQQSGHRAPGSRSPPTL